MAGNEYSNDFASDSDSDIDTDTYSERTSIFGPAHKHTIFYTSRRSQ
jgi:hypothetical protein